MSCCYNFTLLPQTTHDRVRRRALNLVAIWSAEFENDTTLGLMEECYENLKNKGTTVHAQYKRRDTYLSLVA